MKFIVYHPKIAQLPKVLVDGNEVGLGIQFSHWIGNRTPWCFKADLSAEIALRWASSPDRDKWIQNIDIVTNDHFDTDGVLAAWAVLFPDVALSYWKQIIDACTVGDFWEFTTPRAVKFDLIVKCIENKEKSPLNFDTLYGYQKDQLKYDFLLDKMPDILLNPDDYYSDLWTEDYQEIKDSFSSIWQQQCCVIEHLNEHLSVVEIKDKVSIMALYSICRGHRILEIRKSQWGNYLKLHYRYHTWYDIVSRSTTPRHDLTVCVGKLNELSIGKNEEGHWHVNPKYQVALEYLDSSLSAIPSQLSTNLVVNVIKSELARLDQELKFSFVDVKWQLYPSMCQKSES